MSVVDYNPVAVSRISTQLRLRVPNSEALDALAKGLSVASYGDELIADLATGVGKTYIAGGLLEYLYTQGVRNVVIITPGSTIQKKTIDNLTYGHPKYVYGLTCNPLIVTLDDFERGDVATALADESRLKVFVFTVQSLLRPNTKDGRRAHRPHETLGEALYEYLKNCDDLVVIADEHHVYFGRNAKAFTSAVNGLCPSALIGLTATPHEHTNPDCIVYHYPLADAIADGYVKIPVLVARPDQRVDLRTQMMDGVALLEAKTKAIREYAKVTHKPFIQPVMFVVAQTIDEANKISLLLAGPDFFGSPDRVLTITSEESDEVFAQLDLLEHPDSPVHAVVSVSMLKEGWDVKNIYVIAAVRALESDLLTEQILGRGLRLPYGGRTGVSMVDTVEVLSHSSFADLLKHAEVFLSQTLGQRASTVTPHTSSVSGVVSGDGLVSVPEFAAGGSVSFTLPRNDATTHYPPAYDPSAHYPSTHYPPAHYPSTHDPSAYTMSGEPTPNEPIPGRITPGGITPGEFIPGEVAPSDFASGEVVSGGFVPIPDDDPVRYEPRYHTRHVPPSGQGTLFDAPGWDVGESDTCEVGSIATLESRLNTGHDTVEALTTPYPPRTPNGIKLPIYIPQVSYTWTRHQLSLADVSLADVEAFGARFRDHNAPLLTRKMIDAQRTDPSHHANLILTDAEGGTVTASTLPMKWDTICADVVKRLNRSDVGAKTITEKNASESIAQAFLKGAGVTEDAPWDKENGRHASEALAKWIVSEHEKQPPTRTATVTTKSFPNPVATPRTEPTLPTNRHLCTSSRDFVRNQPYIGWDKSVYAVEKFDSYSGEFRIAELLEKSPTVKAWLRINQHVVPLTIEYTRGTVTHTYIPDFIVVDADGTHWIVEGKADNEMESEDVSAKSNAARTWIRIVNSSNRKPDTWAYLLAGETTIRTSRTWDELKIGSRTYN